MLYHLKFQLFSISPQETKNIKITAKKVCIVTDSSNASRFLCFLFSASDTIPLFYELLNTVEGYQYQTSGLYFNIKNITQWTLDLRLIYLF
jgi:hypothetical protein